MLSSPCSVPKGPRGVPALRSGTTPTKGPTAADPRDKYSRGRGTRGGAAAWLSAGVVASTYRATGLVRGPVPLRLPFVRTAPLRLRP